MKKESSPSDERIFNGIVPDDLPPDDTPDEPSPQPGDAAARHHVGDADSDRTPAQAFVNTA